MRWFVVVLLGLSLVLPQTGTLGLAAPAPHPLPSVGPKTEGHFLVKFRNLPAGLIEGLNRAFGSQTLGLIAGIGVHRVSVPVGRTVDEMVSIYRSLHEVEFAEPNFIAEALDTWPNDALFSQQWGPVKVDLPAAWDLQKGSASVIFAVVDTGVDCSHPDLHGRCTGGFNAIKGRQTLDDHGHGTHVAGIAGALTNNTTGVAGVNWQIAIQPVKVLTKDGFGAYADVAEGIVWAANNGARVINLSLGGSSPSDTLRAAVDYAWGKGVLLACAAGNSNGPILYPAAYAHCAAVAATNENDYKAPFSSFGAQIALAAPGTNILSTVPTGGCTLCDPTGYKVLNGTSMATPHVAGLAALLFTNFPGISNAIALNQMEAYADDPGPRGWDKYFGYGRINAYRAIASPLAPPVPPAPPPASMKITSPTWGAPLSGTVTIQVSAGGSVPLKVEIGIRRWGGIHNICRITTSATSVSCSWDTSKGQDGDWAIVATVTDALGEMASDAIRVSVVR